MKRNILLLLFAVLIIHPIMSQDDGKVKIDYLLKEDTPSQWVYLVYSYGNRIDFVDSCYINMGQKRFRFEANMNDSLYSYYDIFFTAKGSPSIHLDLDRGENVELNEKSRTVKGSLTMAEKREHDSIRILNQIKYRFYKDSILKVKEEDRARLTDSLNYFQNQIKTGAALKTIAKARSPMSCYIMLILLEYEIPETAWDSLYADVKARFPEDKRLRNYWVKSNSNSNSNKIIQDRYQAMIDAKNGINTVERKTIKQIDDDIGEIKPYMLGDKIDSLSLVELSGNRILLEEIKTPYILIDFWASWCGPCRREYPNVKKVFETYVDSLTIFAVSFDNNEREWKNTIEMDKLEMFTHVYAGSQLTNAGRRMMKMFGITAIPANFLLDKDRRIIATNLRGENLMKKMEDLIEK
jgi:thiol-disulfide isomerase/thioredoxin